jgi:hypothetical protein
MKDSWRKTLNVFGASYDITKSDVEIPELDRYKTNTGVDLPNNAEFPGDKFPRSGDPAKIELNDWHAQNNEFNKFKKEEDTGDEFGSPLLSDKSRHENVEDKIKDEHVLPKIMGGTKKKGWRTVLADVSVEKKPDGTVKVEVDEGFNRTPDVSQTPLQGEVIPEETQNTEVTSNKVKEWGIKKKGNLRLIGKECVTHCGIAIMNGKKEEEFYKVARNGHSWEELIAQGVWETKFDRIASSEK